jgi:hypothetical protein
MIRFKKRKTRKRWRESRNFGTPPKGKEVKGGKILEKSGISSK